MVLSHFPQEKNASEVMTELNNITTPQVSKTLTESVLVTSLHTLLRLVDFQTAKGNRTLSEMNFTSVYKIASNLLERANKATWREIDSKVGIACFLGSTPGNIWWGCAARFPKTKLCIFPYPTYDLTKNSKPYL